MAKAISISARRELVDPHAPAKMIGLISITPVDGGPPIRICTDATKRLSVSPLRYVTISRGEIYDPLALRLLLPGSSRDELPRTSLEVDNIDPGLIQAIETSPYRAMLDLEVVMSTRPDELVESWPSMEVMRASFDENAVTVQVGYPSLAEEPAVQHRMTLNVFPALRAAA